MGFTLGQRYVYANHLFCFQIRAGFENKNPKRTLEKTVASKLVAFANGHTTMAPAKKKKPAAKTQANEATTTVQRSVYEDDRAQRVAANAQFLDRLELDGGMIQQPAKEARKRSESMRRGALAACLVRISTACMCRKTPDPSPTTELPRRSGRRTTALQPEESAELTATSGSAQTALKIYKLEQYLLNGTPFTTSVPCAVTRSAGPPGIAVAVFDALGC